MGWRQLMLAFCGLDRKFAWSFLGVVLAVLFGVIAIYGQFFADANPHLRYEILANAPVLDVREDITKLSVLFDGIDIRKQNASLRVMSIRILNDSNKDVLKGYYDQNDPLGLSISAGKIIRADLLSASNPYLEKQVTPRQSSDNTLLFPEVILEAKESFIVKLLVLHPESTNPEIRPVGKIAGIRSIPVTETYRQEPTPSLLQRAFAGDILTQVVRLLAYAILVLGALISSLAVAFSRFPDKVAAWRTAKRANRLIKEFRQCANVVRIEILPQDEVVLRDVLANQWAYQKESLPSLLSFMSDSEALRSNYALAMQEMQEAKAKQEAEAAQMRLEKENRERLRCERPERSPAEELATLFRLYIPYYLERGLITETEKGPAVNRHMQDTLRAFTEFLRKKGRLGNPTGTSRVSA